MRRTWLAALTALFVFTPVAGADEMGGSGFAVPQAQQNGWLWGIEGLTRTPVDLAGNIGLTWFDYDAEASINHTDNSGTVNNDGEIHIQNPGAVQGGFRLSGGIGFWQCCVMIEPAMAFWANDPVIGRQKDEGPSIFDPDDSTGDEFTTTEVEIDGGWDLGFGPQITWMIPEGSSFIQRHLGGLPLVFFPYLGLSHSEYDLEMVGRDDGLVTGTFDKDFRTDMFMFGFDLDIPLPGSHGPFTHAVTLGFKYVTTSDDHSFSVMSTNPGNVQNFQIDEFDGFRIGLQYQVTWNDFEGFIKRNLFGPVN